MATMGQMKHRYDPRNVRNDVAEYVSFHGTTSLSQQSGVFLRVPRKGVPQTQARTKHKICPRTMVKYFGNKPAKSQPTGIELLLKLVANVAKA